MSIITRRQAIGTAALSATGIALAGTASAASAQDPAAAASRAAAFAGKHTPKPLRFNPAKLTGLSERLITSHGENNYQGSVRGLNTIETRLAAAMGPVRRRLLCRLAYCSLSFPDGSKVGEIHRLARRYPLLVVVSKELVQKVDRVRRDEVLVVCSHELLPWPPDMPAEDAVKVGVELERVLVEVVEQLVGAEHLCDLDELVVIVVPVEEGLLAEDLTAGGRKVRERGSVSARARPVGRVLGRSGRGPESDGRARSLGARMRFRWSPPAAGHAPKPADGAAHAAQSPRAAENQMSLSEHRESAARSARHGPPGPRAAHTIPANMHPSDHMSSA